MSRVIAKALPPFYLGSGRIIQVANGEIDSMTMSAPAPE